MRTSDSSASIWLWPCLDASPSVSNTAFATATPSANVAASAACAGVVTPAPTKTGEPLASRTRSQRFLMCMRGSYGVTKLFDKIGAANVDLVWSPWRGYWGRPDCAMRKWAERRGVEARFVHSGGHAWPEDLERLVAAVGAGETVWVHTDAPVG